MPFVRAGPAEVLRASQQDDIAIRHLQERFQRIFLYVADFQSFVKHKTHVQLLGQFLYYLNTTLKGLQTLGEEYTGIVQVDRTLRRVPPKSALWLMVVLECLGPTLLTSVQKSLEKRIADKKKTADEAEKSELNLVGFLLKTIPLLAHLHKALFYFSSGTYHISKRISGIHYVLVRFWLKDRASLKGFRFLSLVSSVQLLALFWQNCSEALNRIEIDGKDSRTLTLISSKQCVICVENVVYPTTTPCGHIFCWKCIAEWVQNEERCPVCREAVLPHRLVPLRNYV